MHIKRYQISGISMIELVIFILIMSIAFIGVMTVFTKTQRYSADSMIKIKTVELTQALMEEILLKGYDENTPIGGGCVDNMPDTRCLPASKPDASAAFGADSGETARTLFDDVDDYHNLAYCGTGGTADASCSACIPLIDEQGNNIADEYPGFGVCIQVNFDGGSINTGAGVVRNNDAKRIDIIMSDPSGSNLAFSSYRVNF